MWKKVSSEAKRCPHCGKIEFLNVWIKCRICREPLLKQYYYFGDMYLKEHKECAEGINKRYKIKEEVLEAHAWDYFSCPVCHHKDRILNPGFRNSKEVDYSSFSSYVLGYEKSDIYNRHDIGEPYYVEVECTNCGQSIKRRRHVQDKPFATCYACGRLLRKTEAVVTTGHSRQQVYIHSECLGERKREFLKSSYGKETKRLVWSFVVCLVLGILVPGAIILTTLIWIILAVRYAVIRLNK